MTDTFLQDYCWGIISLLTGLLACQLLVFGANLHLLNPKLDDSRKRMLLLATGKKWGLAFATLLALCGAVYVAFPTFFQTAFFPGAKWIWLLVWAAFFIQLIAFALCLWTPTLLENGLSRIFLALCGFLAPFVLGTFVGTFFTGTDFVVENTLDALMALAHPHALILGLALATLAYLSGALYLLYGTDDSGIRREMYISIRRWLFPFVALLTAWVVLLLFRRGYSVTVDGVVALERGKYFANLMALPAIPAMLLSGIVLVIFGLIRGGYVQEHDGFWFAALGTVILVMAVFFVAGYNGTPYYPSIPDPQTSLTVRNSAADIETLKTFSWVSLSLFLLVPGLLWGWRHVSRKA